MSRNDEVAALLEEFADLLEATGVEYKPTAYRRAAENVREHTAPIENLAGGGRDAVAGSTAWATPSRRRSSSTSRRDRSRSWRRSARSSPPTSGR